MAAGALRVDGVHLFLAEGGEGVFWGLRGRGLAVAAAKEPWTVAELAAK